jgi:mRNA interferase HigB
VTGERIVFNAKGNACRLTAAVDFENGLLWIKWIGMHEDYDRIDAAEVEHGR